MSATRGEPKHRSARHLPRVLAIVLAALAGACGRGDGSRKHALGESRLSGEARQIALALGRGGASGLTLRLAGGDTLHVGPSALSFYRARGWKPAWTDDDGLTEEGRAVAAQLSRTEDDGLSPERYHYSTGTRLAGMMESPRDDVPRALVAAHLDILLSEAFARYADDLAAGTLDPKQLGLEWHLGKEHAPKVQALGLLASGARPDSVVAQLRPHTIAYARMMQALGRLRRIAAGGGWPVLGPSAPSGRASSGTSATTSPAAARRPPAYGSASTAAVRARLMLGEDSLEAGLAAVGRARPDALDPQLRLAVAHYQKRHGLEATGQPSAQTLRELNVPVQERMRTLELNMDRWRWLPRELGGFRVMVNIAAFQAEVLQGDSVVMRQRVVVGKPDWSTPVFADRMVALVVNPYWNVPKSIIATELGPEIEKDPDYLARHHFVPTQDGGYRQLPGPKNSLGRFKFQLTNDEDIYLHDTPQDELFNRTRRTLSHGCIRLEDARAMAHLIGARQGIDGATIDRLVDSGGNRTLEFKAPVPTYIMYFTATAQPDGTIDFYPDVYGLDKRLAPLTPALQGRPIDTTRVTRDSVQVTDSIRAQKASHRGEPTD